MGNIFVEVLSTAFKCGLLISAALLIVRRDLVPLAIRPHLPASLEPYEEADERTRQGFVVALAVLALVGYQFQGGWMHEKD
mmetsp:Transcript_14773/g.44126  ORF Transcript_14773/g.44126 Transcript_14773/m.44126 type:complete len:81 (-) Transcript_14773:48-290(-)